MKKGDLKNAKKHFETTLEIEPEQPTVLINLAVVAMRQKNFGQAEQMCRDAIKVDPNNPDAYFFLGMVYQASGRTFDARKSFEKTLQIDPTHIRALQSLQRM